MSTEGGMGPEDQGRMRVGWEFERKTGKKVEKNPDAYWA